MEQRSGVVYEIPCSTCDKSYIGETIRRLGLRLKEHKDACRKCEKDKSALDEGHPIAWGKVRILNSDNRRIMQARHKSSCTHQRKQHEQGHWS